MAARTPSEKRGNAPDFFTTLNQRLDALQVDIRAAAASNSEITKALADLKTTVALQGQQFASLEHLKQQPGAVADLKTEIALLKRDLDDLKKWQAEMQSREEEWSCKAWLLVPPIVAALVSSLLTGLITYLIHSR